MELERQFLISYISDRKNIIEVLGKKINKKVFGNEVYGWIFELTTWFCQRYSNFPTVNEFEVLLTRSKKINVDTQAKMLLEYRELVKEKETVKDTFSFLLESLLKDYQKRLLKDVLINTGESYKTRNIEELLTDLRSKVVQISEVGKSDSVAGPISESTDDRWNSYVNVRDFPDKFKGIHLGFPTFDQITGGLRKGQLMVVMAGAKEGKCCSKDTEVVLSDGRIETIEKLVRDRKSTLSNVDNTLKLQLETPQDYIYNGIRPVYEVKSYTGRKIKVTKNHPFMTLSGWKQLQELNEGDFIGTPKVLPIFGTKDVSDELVKYLAYIITEGTDTEFTNLNLEIQKDYISSTKIFKDCVCKSDGIDSYGLVGKHTKDLNYKRRIGKRIKKLRESLNLTPKEFVKDLNLHYSSIISVEEGSCFLSNEILKKISQVYNIPFKKLDPKNLSYKKENSAKKFSKENNLDVRAREKKLSDWVFQLPRDKIRLLLGRMWSGDGWCTFTKKASEVAYCSASEVLIHQVQHLLLRLGIISVITSGEVKGRTYYDVYITGKDNVVRFCDEVGPYILGNFRKNIIKLKKYFKNCQGYKHAFCDSFPKDIWKIVEEEMKKSKKTLHDIRYEANYDIDFKNPSNPPIYIIRKIAKILKSKKLNILINSDLCWEKIKSIKYIGEEDTYDITMSKNHCFIANDILVHNSTFLSNAGHNAHVNGHSVLFVTIEMTKQQCERRYDAIDTELDYSLIRDGTLTKVEEDIYKQSLERQKNNKCLYYIYDTPNATVSMIKAKVKSLNQPIDLIVVDYLGIMDSDLRISENWEKVGSIAKELKTLAKDLDVPVLTAAQVNREGIKQQNYKYGKESIALSFLIIAHADIVLSLRNPEPDIQEVSDLLDINATVVANRDDKTFRFQLETCFKKILMKERTFVGGTLYGNSQTDSNKDSNKNGTTVTGNVSEARTDEGSVNKSDVTGDRPF